MGQISGVFLFSHSSRQWQPHFFHFSLIGHISTPGIGGGGGGIAAIFVSHFSCGTQIPEKELSLIN